MASCDDTLHLGLDIGSTTLKLILLDSNSEIVFSRYDRHKFDVRNAIGEAFRAAAPLMRNRTVTAAVTGSAGIQLADVMELPHFQEVVVCATAIKEQLFPEETVDVALELGGEDTKIIYFDRKDCRPVEARMNSTCAAGTGSFIDQMAVLLDTDAGGLNTLAEESSGTLYPIASRCGVFAKSDVLPLLAEGVSKADIAASVFQAVVTQTVAGLSCGRPITGRVLFLGGPLFFLSHLRECFAETLNLGEDDVTMIPQAHMMVCLGAALQGRSLVPMPFEFLQKRFERLTAPTLDLNDPSLSVSSVASETLPPLFSSDEELKEFKERHSKARVTRADPDSTSGPLFLGIDSGSTTTKLVLIDREGQLLSSFYGVHHGNTLRGCIDALLDMHERVGENVMKRIAYCTVTGYGEYLLRTALNTDEGIVETVAHLRAARHFRPSADFVLDIGGQDMKAMSVDSNSGLISEVYLNESCSSGCGTFIQTLAGSMHLSLEEFAQAGLLAPSPLDLGMRCTVFMNSRIKQAQKDGATFDNISAGLALSVVKNALFKVMRLRTSDDAGKNIVVQGGTFLNDAVLRGLELTLNCEAIRPDISGLMGAFGAALEAQSSWHHKNEPHLKTSLLPREELSKLCWETSTRHCGRCTNNCLLTVHEFNNGVEHIIGNRCDKGLGKKERSNVDIPDMWTWQRDKTFEYKPLSRSQASRGSIGIARALHMYDDFPFWCTVFASLGFRVVLSPESSEELFAIGMDSIPDESVCTPVKLLHGHVVSLAQSDVDYIFVPEVPFNLQEDERMEGDQWNCSLMSAYPDVIANNVDFEKFGVRFLCPALPLGSKKQMPVKFFEALESEMPDITLEEVKKAVKEGYDELDRHRAEIVAKGDETLQYMEDTNTPGIVLAGRPYHRDPLLSAVIPNMITSAGYCVLTVEAVCRRGFKVDAPVQNLNFFVYDNRVIAAAKFIKSRRDMSMVHLLSFGCSISPATDETCKDILQAHDVPYCMIKIDQNTSIGAVRVRIRSLIAVLQKREANPPPSVSCVPQGNGLPVLNTSVANLPKSPQTLMLFPFSPPHMKIWMAAFNSEGYNVMFPEVSSADIDAVGLKWASQDLCYGVTTIVGRILYALQHNLVDPDTSDVFWMHYGGCGNCASMAYQIVRALKVAGYPQVTVHTVDFSGSSNPGVGLMQNLRINMSLASGDVLWKCLLRTRPYEKIKNSAQELYNKWESYLEDFLLSKGSIFRFSSILDQIVDEFDNLPLTTEEHTKPRIGLVGLMGQQDLDMFDTLQKYLEKEQGCELLIHGITDYSLMPAVNGQMQYRGGFSENVGKYFGTYVHKFFVNLYRDQAIKALEKSKRFEPMPRIEDLHDLTTKPYMQPTATMSGEGWLHLAHCLDFLRNGVTNIISTLPFCCLPCHVTGRGMFKTIRDLHPDANIAGIDFDSSISFVNQLNRIKLMLECIPERSTETQKVVCNVSDIEEFGNDRCSKCAYENACDVVHPASIAEPNTPDDELPEVFKKLPQSSGWSLVLISSIVVLAVALFGVLLGRRMFESVLY